MTQPIHWLRRGIAAMAGSMLLLSSAAYAGAPQVKTQAPGFYRVMLGDFEVTALFDGTLDLEPKKLLTNTTQAQVGKLLDRSFEKDAVPTSVNGYLINTGSKLVLVDTGAGGLFGPTLGSLQANLKAAGYQPEQVDEIYITHMHGDHVGGLVLDGKLAFPNATMRADKADADFWLSKANMTSRLRRAKGFFQGAMASLKPVCRRPASSSRSRATPSCARHQARSRRTATRRPQRLCGRARARSWCCGAT
jgi:hypothetical protein